MLSLMRNGARNNHKTNFTHARVGDRMIKRRGGKVGPLLFLALLLLLLLLQRLVIERVLKLTIAVPFRRRD